jgi:hypothetical protein
VFWKRIHMYTCQVSQEKLKNGTGLTLCKAVSHWVYWNKDSVRKSLGLIPEKPTSEGLTPTLNQSFSNPYVNILSLVCRPARSGVRSSDCPTKWPVFPVTVVALNRWGRRGHCRRLQGRGKSNPFAVLCERKNWIFKEHCFAMSRMILHC